ncbi:hypothetical protein SK128_021727, partial [Halocaridina rubra]
DGEGWEVVRRGRRSHSGSTASLNNSNNLNGHYQQQGSSIKDSRSGSLKEEGHKGRGLKNRFHMPSAAMSVPSLAVSEDTMSNEAVQKSRDDSTNEIKQEENLLSKSFGTKKFKSQSCVLMREDSSSGSEDKKKSTSGKSSSNTIKKNEKKSKGMTRSAEELSKKYSRRKDSKSKDYNVDNETRNNETKFTNTELIENSSRTGVANDTRDRTIQNSDNQDDPENVPQNYPLPVNHLCDPSIPETSETSDVEDMEKSKSRESKRPSLEDFASKEADTQEHDSLQSEQDT